VLDAMDGAHRGGEFFQFTRLGHRRGEGFSHSTCLPAPRAALTMG